MSSDFKTENKPNEQIQVKKSKKKKIGIISTIVILIPVILAVNYTMNPTDSIISSNKITIDDFPIDMFADNYGILCIKDTSLSCLIANNGIIKHEIKNGVHIFQTNDYSLIKYFSKETGTEEKSISYAFYTEGSQVNIIPYENNNEAFWLITAKGYQ